MRAPFEWYSQGIAGAVTATGVTGQERSVTFRFDCEMETEVAALYLAPGSATTVHMPGPIRKGGLTLKGGEGRITAMQPPSNPNVLVLLASGQPDPERIPLFVATTDGKRYPFMLATLPGVMDSEVRVVSWSEGAEAQPPVDPMLEVLVQDKEIAIRSFKRSRVDDLAFSPWVEKAVRHGDRLYLRIRRMRAPMDRPWKVQAAAVVGPRGERWKVLEVRWVQGEVDDINVILAEPPDEVSEGHTLASIQLRSDDGVEVMLDGKGMLP